MNPEEAEKLCVEAVRIISRESTDGENRHAAGIFGQVADAGYSQGMFGLAEMKMAGKGTPSDVPGAVELYEKAGEMGNVPALMRLGNIYWAEGEFRNPDRAFACFGKCAEAGFPPAFGCLGDCWFYGIGTEKDPGKAVGYYEQASENGDVPAMFKLGCMYGGGMGVGRDDAKSVGMFARAAVNGMPEAMFRMAMLTYEGKIPGGKKGAANWYSQCADAIPVAKFNLATMYYSGDGIDRDLPKAFGLYRSLARQGDADAMFQVGKMLIGGEGTEADAEEGFRHIADAAEAGNAEAAAVINSLRRRQNTQLIKIDGTE